MPVSGGTSRRGNRRRARNQINGTAKVTPMSRPKSRCKYSQKYIFLNSSSVIVKWTTRYSGICWYFVNSAAQSEAVSGGTTPMIGFHSVIDRPERVRRVMPPTTTIAKIMAQQTNSHTATGWSHSPVSALLAMTERLAVAKEIDTPSPHKRRTRQSETVPHRSQVWRVVGRSAGHYAAVRAGLMQQKRRLEVAESRPPQNFGLADLHGMQLAVDVVAPKIQKPTQLGKVR